MKKIIVQFILLSSFTFAFADISKTVPSTSNQQIRYLEKIFHKKLSGDYYSVSETIEKYFFEQRDKSFADFEQGLILLLGQVGSLQGDNVRAFTILKQLEKYIPIMESDFYLRWNLELKALSRNLGKEKDFRFYLSRSKALENWLIQKGKGCSTLLKCNDFMFPSLSIKNIRQVNLFPFDDSMKWLPVNNEELAPVDFYSDKWENQENVWAYTEINVKRTGIVRFYIGIEGACVIWIDGQPVFFHDLPHAFEPIQFVFQKKLTSGPHSIQVLLMEKNKTIKFTMRAFQGKIPVNSLPLRNWSLSNFQKKPEVDLDKVRKDLKVWQKNFFSNPFLLRVNKQAFPIFRALMLYSDGLYSYKNPNHKNILKEFLEQLPNQNIFGPNQKKLFGNASLYYQALFHSNLNQRKDMLDSLIEKIKKRKKPFVEIYFQKAKIYYRQKDYNRFYHLVDRILTMNETFVPAHQAKITYLRQRGWLREASVALNVFENTSAQSFHYLSQKAKLMKRLKMQKEEKDTLETLVFKNLFSRTSEGALEKIYLKEKDQIKYLSLLKLKSRLASNPYPYFQDLSEYYFRVSNFHGAISQKIQMLKRSPFDTNLHLQLASLNKRMGSVKSSNWHLQMAKKLNPTSFKVKIAEFAHLGIVRKNGAFESHEESLKKFLPYLDKKESISVIKDYLYERGKGKNRKWVTKNSTNQVTAEIIEKKKITLIFKGGRKLEFYRNIIHIQNENGVKPFSTQSIVYSPENEKLTLLEASVRNSKSSKGIIWDESSFDTFHSQNIFEQSLSDPESRLYYDSKARVYVLPSVQKGSIITFSYIKEIKKSKDFGDYITDQFSITSNYPVWHADYTLVNESNNHLFYKARNLKNPILNIKKINNKKVYWFSGNKFFPFPKVDFAPPKGLHKKEIIFTSFRDWKELGTWMRKLISDRFTLDSSLESFITKLSKKNLSKKAKVKRVLQWVTKRIRYVGLEYGIGGYQPRRAEMVSNTGFGDCKDMSTLSVSLLKALGVKAHIALVRTKDRGPVDRGIPFLGAFNHAIIYFQLPKKGKGRRDFFYDATSDHSGFGELPWSDEGIEAFVLSEDPHFIAIPVSKSNSNGTRVDNIGQIKENGDLIFRRKLSKTGLFAINARSQYQNKEERKNSIQSYWNHAYPNNKISNLVFSDLKDKQKPVVFSYDIFLSNYIEKTDSFYLFKPFLFTSNMIQNYALKPQRNHALFFSFASRIEVVSKFFFPSHWRVHQMPGDIIKKNKFAEYGFSYKVVKRKKRSYLLINSWIDLKRDWLDKELYASFREFCAQIDEKERDWIIFR